MAMLVSLESNDFKKISRNMTEEVLPLSVLRFVEIMFPLCEKQYFFILYHKNIKFLSF